MSTKRCNKCLNVKDFSLFFKDKNNKTDGRYSICKECKTTNSMGWRAANKDRYNSNMRLFRATNKEMFKGIDLKRTYGITFEDYTRMLVEQDYKCKICKNPNTSTKRTLAVDHDHITGEIRGLLCYGCNRALHTLESETLLTEALKYLKKKSA